MMTPPPTAIPLKNPMIRKVRLPPELTAAKLLLSAKLFAGVATVILYNICMSIMQALGDSLHPLYYLIFSSLVNVALGCPRN